MKKNEILNLHAETQKIDNLNQSIYEMMRKSQRRMEDAIYDMLTELGGEYKVDFTLDEDYPIITYDGGNHAEYRSTICAVVTKIKANLKNGLKTFVVDIQDEEEDYEAERMYFGDVATIFDFVCGQFSEHMADLKIKPKNPKKTQNYRFTYRVETFIEAESPSDAQSKFDEIEFPSNMDFVEMVSFEDEDGYEIDED